MSYSFNAIPILGAQDQKFNQPTRGIDLGLQVSRVWPCVVGSLVTDVSKEMLAQRDKS